MSQQLSDRHLVSRGGIGCRRGWQRVASQRQQPSTSCKDRKRGGMASRWMVQALEMPSDCWPDSAVLGCAPTPKSVIRAAGLLYATGGICRVCATPSPMGYSSCDTKSDRCAGEPHIFGLLNVIPVKPKLMGVAWPEAWMPHGIHKHQTFAIEATAVKPENRREPGSLGGGEQAV